MLARALEVATALVQGQRQLAAAKTARSAAVTGDTNTQLAALFDAIAVLDGLGVPYALIGGLAVGVHTGVPRATQDVDLAVGGALDRTALVRAMQRAGFTPAGEFVHSCNFRHRSGEPVQLATAADFEGPVARAENITVQGRRVRVVNKDDLLQMKERAAADPALRRSKALRDQADAALLRGDVPDPDEGW